MHDRALGYERITGLSAVKGLTVPAGASKARIVATVQTVRYRDDGTDPTSTVGMPLLVNTGIDYTGDLARIRFIETAASAILEVCYYG